VDQEELDRRLTRFFLRKAPPDMSIEEAKEFLTEKLEEFGLGPDEVQDIANEAESVRLTSDKEFEKFLFALLEQHRGKNQN
jgi:hypothetical protein